jgi:hypothetical protein
MADFELGKTYKEAGVIYFNSSSRNEENYLTIQGI